MTDHEIIVIGGGPAGLAAAIEARRSGVDDILILERESELGGILQQCIHYGFGLHIFKEELTGPEYAERFIDEAKALAIPCKTDTMVLDISPQKEVSFVNPVDGFRTIKARAIILAMGCRENTRGAIGLPGSRPAGIFSAGAAQKLINIEGYMVGKKVVIMGTGDIGLIMARRLALEGAEVKAIMARKPYPGGLTRNVVQCLHDYNIPLLLKHTITSVSGEERVEGVTVVKLDDRERPLPGTEEFMECDTLLLSVGLIPENELSLKAGVMMDRGSRGPVVSESRETSVEGIFACGNVLHVHDIVDFVTEESRIAGRAAADYVRAGSGEREPGGRKITVRPERGIKYIVPHTIDVAKIGESIDLMFRVDRMYKKARLILKGDGRILKTRKGIRIYPGEMEMMPLRADMLKDVSVLSVEVEEVPEE
ncbi:MAG: FAD-dependent oxidoreductase [Firmicutes bacterium]|jgi:thioredoxin reductase|nr:FAD-dependent oxidoreductase [Bacillota bacterium]